MLLPPRPVLANHQRLSAAEWQRQRRRARIALAFHGSEAIQIAVMTIAAICFAAGAVLVMQEGHAKWYGFCAGAVALVLLTVGLPNPLDASKYRLAVLETEPQSADAWAVLEELAKRYPSLATHLEQWKASDEPLLWRDVSAFLQAAVDLDHNRGTTDAALTA